MSTIRCIGYIIWKAKHMCIWQRERMDRMYPPMRQLNNFLVHIDYQLHAQVPDDHYCTDVRHMMITYSWLPRYITAYHRLVTNDQAMPLSK
jgi:hypothetical protein